MAFKVKNGLAIQSGGLRIGTTATSGNVLTTDSSGNLTLQPVPAGGTVNIKTATRTADKYLVSPQYDIFISDTFIPDGTIVEFDITISVGIITASQAVSWDLFYGNNAVVPAGQLTKKSQDVALGTGVTQRTLPSTSSAHGNLSATLQLTGLTPGATYRYEISQSIVGGAGGSAIHPGNPFRIAAARDFLGNPEWGVMLGVAMGGTDVAFIVSDRYARFGDRISGTISLPGMSTPFIAMSPNGTKAVVTSQLGTAQQSVFVINTGAATYVNSGDLVGVPTLAATITLAASEIVQPVAINPAGTRAWIGFQGTAGRAGTIVPIDLATNAITTPASAALVSPTSAGNITDIVIDSTGTYAYVCVGVASNNIKKVDLATGAVAATGSAGITPYCLAISPDNSTLYIASSTAPGSIVTMTTSALAVTNTVAINPTSATVQDIEVMSDGLSVFMVSGTATDGAQIIQYVPAYGANYTQWPLDPPNNRGAYGLALTKYGDIWVTNYTGQDVRCWPGCQSRYSLTPATTSDIGEMSFVRIRGAT